MRSNAIPIATAAVVLLIAASALVVYFDLSKSGYEYRVVKGDVEFLSSGAQPQDYLRAAAGGGTFLVVPEFGTSNASPEMTSALTLFSAVLGANGKETVILGRVADSSGKTLLCQTNRGSRNVSEEIGAEECDALLSDDSYLRVRIRQIDASLASTKVVLSEGIIEISPSSAPGLSDACYFTLESMFPNTGDVVSAANELLGALGGQGSA